MRIPVSIAAVMVSLSVAAQAPRLGAIDFPTSASGDAQAAFVEGVLFLHSFEFTAAAVAFRRAQAADPGFAMAYWGEAMTYNHPLWGEWDDAAARAALGRLGATPEARRVKAPTHREQMYLAAVEALWADGPKPARDTAYSQAMARLVETHADDDEARALYALSLLGLSGTTRVVATYMRGAAIAQEVFARQPNHPGAAHYIIHSFDDPTHAPLGLPAAHAYSRIAPDAAHAQHMTTHIFLALGMWDAVVSQNEIAAGLTSWGPGHYTAWLVYAQLQQGRLDVARAQLERARREMGATPSVGRRSYLATMRSHYVINSERWDDPALGWSLDLEGVWPLARAMDVFVAGYAAERRGDVEVARERLAALRGLGAASERGQILAMVLDAALTRRAGETDRAVQLLREAGAMEDALPVEFGPPDVVKSPYELLGEILLVEGRHAEAREAFRQALMLTPGRRLAARGHAAAIERQAGR